MKKNYTSFSTLKFNGGIIVLLMVALFGCAKRDASVSSSYELQKQRSLELENPNPIGATPNADIAVESQIDNSSSNKTIENNTLKNSSSTETPVGRDYTAKELKQSKKIQAKVDKLRNKIVKKTEKMQESAKGGGLSQNLKLGLILILVGILIALVLGSLLSSYALYIIGVLIVIVGVVFLILGLLEM